MENKLIIVGIGPGHKDYIIPLALREINEAEVLVGSKRALDTFSQEHQNTIEVTGNLLDVVAKIKANVGKKRIVVLVSGDPTFYSLVPYLKKHLPQSEFNIIPGLSSVQIAFCRQNMMQHDAKLLSLHGREYADIKELLKEPCKAAFLTDAKYSPKVIAKLLLQNGWANCEVFLGERLSYEDENILMLDLISAQTVEGFSHSVMVVNGQNE